MKDFEIIFYDKPDGSGPAKDFLLSLDKKMRAIILMLTELLSKKSQKTPKKEIELAKKYRNEFLNRKGESK